MNNQGVVILMTVKKQVAKCYRTDASKVVYDKHGSHDQYIHLEVCGKHEVRVEMDLEDHDWWVEEKIDGVWKRKNIITI